MKRLFLLFIPLVFFFGCEEDDLINPNSTEGGVAVKWFGCNGCFGDFNAPDKVVWYTDEVPYFSLMQGDDWDETLECEEIILFQNDGHVNWRTTSDPNIWMSMTINNDLNNISGTSEIPVLFWEEF